MSRPRPALAVLGLALGAAGARADSHPPGVPYPLRPAALQPSDLAQPLPSTRRYVLVWKDQIIPDGHTAAEKHFVVTHYVGSQKLFQRQIDEYRMDNPQFLLLVYHLAYGLNGADQSQPVGNITGPNQFGQEDTDTFTPFVAARSIMREQAYQHSAAPPSMQNRVSYPDPYWLMDIASSEWQGYLADTLLGWSAFPTAKATGVFFDVSFFPWFDYSPPGWWAAPAGDGSRAGLAAWWNPRAQAYFDGLRGALAPAAGHPRYLVLPNVDAMVDGTDEPAFLAGTDGAFTENWQAILANPGDWNLSVRRLCRYVTGAGKAWLADVTQAGTALAASDRELLIGTFLLVRNGTSYLMFGNADLTWYPEYEIDLGGYLDEPSTDLETLRVAGSGGASGGLYLRPYASGLVLVNSSEAPLAFTLARTLKRAHWSGGGTIQPDGTLAAQSLTYAEDVPAGVLSVPARSVIVLRDPAGAPPPGEEGQGGAADAGVVPPADAGGPGAVDAATAKADAGAPVDARPPSDAGIDGSASSAGCSCRAGGSSSDSRGAAAILAVAALIAWRRRRRLRAARGAPRPRGLRRIAGRGSRLRHPTRRFAGDYSTQGPGHDREGRCALRWAAGPGSRPRWAAR